MTFVKHKSQRSQVTSSLKDFFFRDPLIQGGGGEQTLSVHGKRWESSSILSGGRTCGPVMLFRNDSVGVQRRLQPGSEVPSRGFSKQTNYMPEAPGNAQAWLHLRVSGDKDLGNVTRMWTLNHITKKSLYMHLYMRDTNGQNILKW